MTLKKIIRNVVRKTIGYDLVRYSPASHGLARRAQLLKYYKIETVLDVGANTGQYSMELREVGYCNRIVSFEPLSGAFGQLQATAATDPLWDVCNYALGAVDGTSAINIAGNSVSSSLLGMLPSHMNSAPGSGYIGSEQIEVRALDSCFDALNLHGRAIWLKIDTQGFEMEVLKGAATSLKVIDTIQIEMSFRPLYEDGASMQDLFATLDDMGYRLVAMEPGYCDPVSGEMLQADGIFHRHK